MKAAALTRIAILSAAKATTPDICHNSVLMILFAIIGFVFIGLARAATPASGGRRLHTPQNAVPRPTRPSRCTCSRAGLLIVAPHAFKRFKRDAAIGERTKHP